MALDGRTESRGWLPDLWRAFWMVGGQGNGEMMINPSSRFCLFSLLYVGQILLLLLLLLCPLPCFRDTGLGSRLFKCKRFQILLTEKKKILFLIRFKHGSAPAFERALLSFRQVGNKQQNGELKSPHHEVWMESGRRCKCGNYPVWCDLTEPNRRHYLIKRFQKKKKRKKKKGIIIITFHLSDPYQPPLTAR